MASASEPVVAVLYQSLAPPMYGGVSKPPKPGGYRDSGSDIAFTLSRTGTTVLTPVDNPDPADQNHWCFPDTEEGILSAVQRGATHLWANTILFATHPLQTSAQLTPYEDKIKIVGQPPLCVDRFDDKSCLNDALRRRGGFTVPGSWIIDATYSTGPNALDGILVSAIRDSGLPLVAKPVRGRGSHGVKVCHDPAQLKDHVTHLLAESSAVMLEEYLSGEEGTITVMPPAVSTSQYTGHWALPPVIRFNHVDGVVPYSGAVAATANSRAVAPADRESDQTYADIMKQCEAVGDLLGTTAPIRIDIRRFGSRTEFALFDVNMKPNMTGPGRPGRDDQTNLTGLAAGVLGWDYGFFLQHVLGSARRLGELRNYTSPLLE